MNKILIAIGSYILFCNMTYASVSQNEWWAAHNKNDASAQYTLACAYDPQDEAQRSDECQRIDRNNYCGYGQFTLNIPSEDGGCKNKETEKYIYWLKKAATNGNWHAQVDLGFHYAKGELIAKDISQGLRWLNVAANRGVGEAQYRLAYLYQQGDDVKADYKKAIELYQASANSFDWGYTGLAQYQLYQLYQVQLQEPVKAFYWQEQAARKIGQFADKKVYPLPYQIAIHYLQGGTPDGGMQALPDYLRAVKWLNITIDHRSYVSKPDALDAYLSLGWLYLTGNGVVENIPQAVELYTTGLERYEPEHLVTPADPSTLQSRTLRFIQSAYSNSIDPASANLLLDELFAQQPEKKQVFLLALMDIFSRNVEILPYHKEYRYTTEYDQNFMALSLFAAKNDIAEAWYTLGKHGQNINQSIAAYQKTLALDPEHSNALFELAVLYDFYLPKTELAVPLYQRAAELEHVLASYRLGVLSYQGKGTEQNYRATWRWLNQATSQQYSSAGQFQIKIAADHPEAEWLKAQYLNHSQAFVSPAVIVDDNDWLEQQTDSSAMANYHWVRRDSKVKDFVLKNPPRKLCSAALKYAVNGNRETRASFIAQISEKPASYHCEAPIDTMRQWINETDKPEQEKRYLIALLYAVYTDDANSVKTSKAMLDQLVAENYDKALTYQAKKILDTEVYKPVKRQDKNKIKNALTQAYRAVEQGNEKAMSLLVDYYQTSCCGMPESPHADGYLANKMQLLRSDHANIYQSSPTAWGNSDKLKAVSPYPILPSSTLYKMWFEIAEMYQTGQGIPQDLSMAYIWYALLAEHQRSGAQEQLDKIERQLTPEKLSAAQQRLQRYRIAYSQYPL